MGTQTEKITVIGGGLAGTEAAWQIAKLGVHVDLYEMRPERSTEAHVTDQLSELVCSNSLGSTILHKAPGLLKAEMRGLGSLIIDCATQTAVPAGSSTQTHFLEAPAPAGLAAQPSRAR